MARFTFRHYNFARSIEVAANVGIVIVCTLLIATMYRQFHFGPIRLGNSGQSVKAGDTLDIEDVNWSASSQTLVLALNRTCKYCTASAPFYRRLSLARESAGFTLIAAFPHREEESRAYLHEMGFSVDAIAEIDLSKANIRGTPTILLVDSGGTVTDVWPGQLDAEGEKAVMSRLRVSESD